MKMLFIGAGNMGQAIIGGIIKNKVTSSKDIYIFEINKNTQKYVLKKYAVKIQENIDTSISDFDIIFFAVKPQVFIKFNYDKIMNKLKDLVSDNQLIVSIMAGISIKSISSLFNGPRPIIRVMPSAPALIGQSMSVLSTSKNVTKPQLGLVKRIFSSIGEIEIVKEKDLDAVTGLSGSGPAYVFTFIESLIEGGIECGLKKSIAEKLAIQTVFGASQMIDKNNNVIELREKVTSPGGTTIEGLKVLEKKGFKSIVVDAIKSATNRSIELSTMNNN